MFTPLDPSCLECLSPICPRKRKRKRKREKEHSIPHSLPVKRESSDPPASFHCENEKAFSTMNAIKQVFDTLSYRKEPRTTIPLNSVNTSIDYLINESSSSKGKKKTTCKTNSVPPLFLQIEENNTFLRHYFRSQCTHGKFSREKRTLFLGNDHHM